MLEYLEIGKIANTHGVKGELKVIPLTDDPQRFNKLKSVLIDRNNTLESHEIEHVKYHKNMVIIKLKDVNDMTAAESLKNLYMKVDRKNAVKLPKDAYFICDLIDCEVFDEKGSLLGKIADIIKTGSNDVYIVRNENGKEILVPALKSVVREISIEDKVIKVILPEGLVEDEV